MPLYSGRLTLPPLRFIPVLLCLLAGAGHAQTIAPCATVPAGAHGRAGGLDLEWSLGQVVDHSFGSGTSRLTAGVLQPDAAFLRVRIRMLLDGAFDDALGLMTDELRNAALVPLNEPYTAAGLPRTGPPAGIALTPSALLDTGANAIVDWVFVELRSATNPGTVVAARAALLQRDGDVVDGDGGSPLLMAVSPGMYHVAVHHRNHLPVMSGQPLLLDHTHAPVDLSDGSIPTHGNEAQRYHAGLYRAWAGDVNGDGTVKYTGGLNDRDPVLQAIGGAPPTLSITGYHMADVNMDGTVKYTGLGNDRDPILRTIGGNVPTETREAQMP